MIKEQQMGNLNNNRDRMQSHWSQGRRVQLDRPLMVLMQPSRAQASQWGPLHPAQLRCLVRSFRRQWCWMPPRGPSQSQPAAESWHCWSAAVLSGATVNFSGEVLPYPVNQHQVQRILIRRWAQSHQGELAAPSLYYKPYRLSLF